MQTKGPDRKENANAPDTATGAIVPASTETAIAPPVPLGTVDPSTGYGIGQRPSKDGKKVTAVPFAVRREYTAEQFAAVASVAPGLAERMIDRGARLNERIYNALNPDPLANDRAALETHLKLYVPAKKQSILAGIRIIRPVEQSK